jgi:hypothetical protein
MTGSPEYSEPSGSAEFESHRHVLPSHDSHRENLGIISVRETSAPNRNHPGLASTLMVTTIAKPKNGVSQLNTDTDATNTTK